MTDASRNQSTRAPDLAGRIFLRGGVAGFCRVSSQRACVACASPLPRQAPGRAPGCPRCATLPGPQGHPGLPPPPTVPRLSGSQSPWYLPSPRGPAPMPSLLHRKLDLTLRTRVRILRDSGRAFPELRDRLTENSGLPCLPCPALPVVLPLPRPQCLLRPALLCQQLGTSALLRTQPLCPLYPEEAQPSWRECLGNQGSEAQ